MANPSPVTDKLAVLREIEQWLDGIRTETDRARFERRWNTLQDEAAWHRYQLSLVLEEIRPLIEAAKEPEAEIEHETGCSWHYSPPEDKRCTCGVRERVEAGRAD